MLNDVTLKPGDIQLLWSLCILWPPVRLDFNVESGNYQSMVSPSVCMCMAFVTLTSCLLPCLMVIHSSKWPCLEQGCIYDVLLWWGRWTIWVADEKLMCSTGFKECKVTPVWDVYAISSHYTFPSCVVCTYPCIGITKYDEFICSRQCNNCWLKVFIEPFLDTIMVCLDRAIGIYKCGMLLSWDWQQNCHQTIIATIGRVRMPADKVGFDSKTKPYLTAFILTTFYPEECVICRHLWELTFCSQPGLTQDCYMYITLFI